jgi:hypothetical protein
MLQRNMSFVFVDPSRVSRYLLPLYFLLYLQRRALQQICGFGHGRLGPDRAAAALPEPQKKSSVEINILPPSWPGVRPSTLVPFFKERPKKETWMAAIFYPGIIDASFSPGY